MTMRPLYLSFSPSAEDTDGFANDVSGTSGVAFVLAATTVPDGLAHKIIITPSGSVTGNYIITGTDANGVSQTETLATSTTNPVTSAGYFKTITSILAPSGIGANTVDIGWVDEFSSITIPIERYLQGNTVNCQVNLTGTANFDIEDTMDDIYGTYTDPPAQNELTWLDDANFINKSAGLSSPLAVVARAIRLVINSYNSGAVLQLDVITPK